MINSVLVGISVLLCEENTTAMYRLAGAKSSRFLQLTAPLLNEKACQGRAYQLKSLLKVSFSQN
jgi:hypothetical protein